MKYTSLNPEGESFEVPMMDGFPMEETFEDFVGNQRTFIVHCHQLDDGFALDAFEKDRKGYEFSAWSETSYGAGLGNLRVKIRRMLATRHITRKGDRVEMMHDVLRGRIGVDLENGLCLYIDGEAMSIADLCDILETHEGFQFKLEISDPSDDISR